MAESLDQNRTPPVKPDQAARLIRFALSELTFENGHHDFEHICRLLTRKRICSNVIPATGPVSGGGDQGADFETFPVANSSSASPFFLLATEQKWIFACSLEKNVKKKVKSDLASVANGLPRADKLFFFHHLPIKVADRHKLQRFAIEQHRIELEIFDGMAIAELLSDADTVWIAQRYLSLHSEFILQRNQAGSTWYQHLLGDETSPLTSGHFFEIRDAVREAAHDPESRSHALILFKKLRQYRDHWTHISDLNLRN
jgi:hypothetical protein